MSYKTNSFLKTDEHISICFSDGYHTTVYTDNKNFDKIYQAAKNEQWEKVRDLVSVSDKINKQLSFVHQDIKIEHGVVYFENEPLHTSLTIRMLEMLHQELDITPLCNFLTNLMQNTSYRAVNELYTFLEASDLPITSDGHFLAYKKITDDYKDVRTHSIDNSIGCMVEMKRNQVDEDKNRTCSSGLHFCARSYLDHYGGSRIVVVKINPADVVAIPVDYDNAKGRTCRYLVIQELDFDNPEPLESLYTNNDAIAKLEQIDSDGQVVNRFNSIQEAEQETGIKKEYIGRVLRNDRKYTMGYTWRWQLRSSN